MITFEWKMGEKYGDALKRLITENGVVNLANMFLKREDISWQSGNVGERFSEDVIIEELFLFHYDELGDKLWYQLVSNAFLWRKLTTLHVTRAINTKFIHEETDIDGLKLMQVLAPMITPQDIFSHDHRNLMRRNRDFALPYFKSLNDKITKQNATTIYMVFSRNAIMDDNGVIPSEAQNWLIDNNKYIQQLIVDSNEEEIFPNAAVRDIFLF